MARKTIETMSAQPKIKSFGNHLLVDLNEFKDKGFSIDNVNWSVEGGTLIVTFRYDGVPNGTVVVGETAVKEVPDEQHF